MAHESSGVAAPGDPDPGGPDPGGPDPAGPDPAGHQAPTAPTTPPAPEQPTSGPPAPGPPASGSSTQELPVLRPPPPSGEPPRGRATVPAPPAGAPPSAAAPPAADHTRPAAPPTPPGAGYASLQAALTRAVTPAGWRRMPVRAVYPVIAGIGVLLVLSLLGVAAPWSASTAPARGDGPDPKSGPVLVSPPTDGHAPPAPGQARAGDPASPGAEPGGPAGGGSGDCEPSLSVVAAPDAAPLVRELAGSLARGDCPEVTVLAEQPTATLNALAGGGAAPDVWIPDSTMWLRQATVGEGADLPTSGTSVARTPVVLALPTPLADRLAESGDWPVWPVYHRWVTQGDIPRMSMVDTSTTVGALALVSLSAAVENHWSEEPGGGFLHLLNYRDHVVTREADAARLLGRLATTAESQAASQVGAFPATEQQLHAYHRRGPQTRVTALGFFDAHVGADYPMAIATGLGDRLAAIADSLRAQLRSPAAARRLVEAGFRPPADSSTRPGALSNTDQFPDYPEPIALPSPARWQELLDGWYWEG